MKKFLILCFSLLICLSGCVRYDVGINFDQANKGSIIQHIKLGDQLTSFSKSEANAWLKSIEERAFKLQGQTKKISDQEIVVSIPFINGKDLVSKFNTFFNPSDLGKKNQKAKFSELLKLKAEMSIKQSNLLLFERSVLKIDADLRPLGVLSEDGNIIISPGNLIDLELQLNFPTKVIKNELSSPVNSSSTNTILKLQPGQINQIETVFWFPNYIGLGFLAIAIFIIGGFYLKYRQLPLIN